MPERNFNTVDPAMMGQAQAQAKPSSLSGYTGTGGSSYVVGQDLTEYDPYHRLKVSFLNSVGGILDKSIERSREHVYIEGMSAYMSGVVEDEMDTHPLTKAWSQAGYRDTSGRMALVDYKAKLINDIETKFAAESPEVFRQHLQNSRPMVMRHLEEASSVSKAELLKSLVSHEATLIQKHADAHAKFAYQVEQNTLSAEMNLAIAELNSSQFDSTYPQAVHGVFQTVQATLNNPRLSGGEGIKSVMQLIKGVADNGHPDLAEQLLVRGNFDINGHPVNLVELGEFEDVENVWKAIRGSKRTNRDSRMFEDMNKWEGAVEQAQLDPSFNIQPTVDEVHNAIIRGDITRSQGMGILRKLHSRGGVNDDGTPKLTPEEMVSLWVRGDEAEMLRLGVSNTAARRAALESVKDLPKAEQLAYFTQVASNGNPDGSKMVGMIASPAISRFYNSGELSEEDTEIINAFINVFNTSGFQDNPALTFESLIQGLPAEEAMFLRGSFDRVSKYDPTQRTEDVWRDALQQQRSHMIGTPQHAQTIQSRVKEMHSVIDQQTNEPDRSFFNRLDLFNRPHRIENIIPNNPFTAGIKWWHKGHRNVNQQAKHVFRGTAKQVAESMANTTGGDSEYIAQQAQAEVVKNSFLLEGDTFAGTFVGNPYNPISEAIGHVDGTVPPDVVAQETVHTLLEDAVTSLERATGRDVRVIASYNAGVLSAQLFDNDTGIQIGAPTWNNADLQNAASYIGKNEHARREAAAGQSQVYIIPKRQGAQRLPSHLSDNPRGNEKFLITAERDPEWDNGFQWDDLEMVAIRKSIIDMEDFSWTWYEDGTGGRRSIGVGGNTGNPITTKYVSPRASSIDIDTAQKMFVAHTTNAMSEAESLRVSLPAGANETPYKTLLTHFAFQSGLPTLQRSKPFKAMQEALNRGSAVEAKEYLKQTPAYKSSGARRRALYEQLIDGIF